MIFNSTKPLDFKIERKKRIDEFCEKNVDEELLNQLKHYYQVTKYDVL